ncbi:MAG TPA: ATP-binding protein [Solirubrobacteraceae bacterium]|nr:ATP-binding protein [Solirubrobacteraceae bacterium]
MSLRARLLAAITYVLLLAIVAYGVPLGLTLSARVNAEVRSQALAQSYLVAATAGHLLGRSARVELATLARSAATSIRGRVLIVDRNGRVLADSAGPAQLGVSYRSRPEIAAALAGHPIQLQRASRTLSTELLATALPIISDGRTAGAVRVTESVAAIDQAVRRVELAILLVGGIVLALGLVAASVLAGQLAGPLRRLEDVARRVARGDLRARAAVDGSREQRSLSRSFNHMADRVEALLTAQRRFVADASHQLRTPLTGMRLRLEEARALSSSADVHAELDAAIGELDRLARTVEHLLARSSAGQRTTAATTLELELLARDAATRWSAIARERAITVVARCEHEPGIIWADRGDVERALDALVENAIRYSPAETTVTIAAAPGRIEVRDRGPGIALSERDRVFERFRRGGAGLMGPPGHGLGLPIARELARGWGGEITISGRPGGGTTATLALSQHTARDRPGEGFAKA